MINISWCIKTIAIMLCYHFKLFWVRCCL